MRTNRIACLLLLLLAFSAGIQPASAADVTDPSTHKPALDPDDKFLKEVESELKTGKKPENKQHDPQYQHHPHPHYWLGDLFQQSLSWDRFVEGWRQDVFRNPVIAAGLAGLLLGFLGVFIVLRRMVFVSAAISQASAAGVVVIYLLIAYAGLSGPLASPTIGAIGFGLIASLVVILDPTRLGLTRESVLGLVFLFSSAFGLALMVRVPEELHDIQAVIFGHAVSVSDSDLTAVVILVSVALPMLLAWQRLFLFVGYDRVSARVQELPTRSLELLLFLTIGISIALCTKILGALSVFAFSVLPAMAALALTRRAWLAFTLASLFGILAGSGGYIVATLYSYPVGASQTLLAASIALSAALFHLIHRRVLAFSSRRRRNVTQHAVSN